jgi:hypothetical protein
MNANSREQLAEMMFDLGDHAARSVPQRGLILEAPVTHQRRVARSAAWAGQQILDLPLQDFVRRQADRIPHLCRSETSSNR